jgi:hypothetical protein
VQRGCEGRARRRFGPRGGLDLNVVTVDVDAVLAADAPVDAGELLRWVCRIAGPDDARFARIARVLAT